MPAPRICLLGVGLYTRADASRLVKMRSEEHTSELQSQSNLVCRLLLEKKKINNQLLIYLFINSQHIFHLPTFLLTTILARMLILIFAELGATIRPFMARRCSSHDPCVH